MYITYGSATAVGRPGRGGNCALNVAPMHGGSLRSLLKSSRSPLAGLRPQSVAKAAALWLVIGWCIARHHRQPVHHPGRVRQVLADPQPRRGRRDRAERAADFGRRGGLHVHRVDVARAAVVEDQDARPDRRRPAGPTSRLPPALAVPRRLGPQERGQGEPQRPQAADLQQPASAQPALVAHRRDPSRRGPIPARAGAWDGRQAPVLRHSCRPPGVFNDSWRIGPHPEVCNPVPRLAQGLEGVGKGFATQCMKPFGDIVTGGE